MFSPTTVECALSKVCVIERNGDGMNGGCKTGFFARDPQKTGCNQQLPLVSHNLGGNARCSVITLLACDAASHAEFSSI